MNTAIELDQRAAGVSPAGLVPCGTSFSAQLLTLNGDSLQPIMDVRAYLNRREPVANCLEEEALRITLPNKAPHFVRNEATALNRACARVLTRVNEGASVQSACKAVLANFKEWHWNLTTFRQKFDLWRESGDWTTLVNKAKAGGGWIDRDDELPDAFLKHCEQLFGAFGRADGKRQAIISLHRHWKTGRNHHGVEQPIDGYEVLADGVHWEQRDRENIPDGWTYDNIRRQILKRDRFTKGVRALLHEGESAAREHLPQIIGTKSNLRFLEEITFDDVRFDYLILNEETGFAEELWALVAREQSCRLVLGGVLFPASVREDGKAAHLGAKQMKELAGYLLQTYPLPPYVMRWIVERGTATLREAVRLALAELFDNRVSVHYTSMIGGRSATGYLEKKKGNSRGKGSHESHNRLFHTQGSFLPGQTGAHYGIRPADLKARCEEAEKIWQETRHLPEHLRAQVQYPLLTVRQARGMFNKFSLDQNFRTDHKIEGFDEVIEMWNAETRLWEVRDSAALPDTRHPTLDTFRTRMESPVERAAKKIREVEAQFGANAWTRPSPEVVCAFLDHSQRRVVVKDNGRIKLDHEGQSLYFEHGGAPLKTGTKALAYHHCDNPEFLILTDGDGRILGVWFQVGRVPSQDRDAIAQAMRQNHAALANAKAIAGELAAPQVADLESMRRHNAELQNFITVTDAPKSSNGQLPVAEVATSLGAAHAVAAKIKSREQRFAPHIKPAVDNLAELLAAAEKLETPNT
jgi:hypothetical protein